MCDGKGVVFPAVWGVTLNDAGGSEWVTVYTEIYSGTRGAEGAGAGGIDEVPVEEHAVPHRWRRQEHRAPYRPEAVDPPGRAAHDLFRSRGLSEEPRAVEAGHLQRLFDEGVRYDMGRMHHISVSPGGLFHGRDRHTTALRVMIPTGNCKAPFTAANFANERRSSSRADTYQNGMPIPQEPEAAGPAHPSFVFPFANT